MHQLTRRVFSESAFLAALATFLAPGCATLPAALPGILSVITDGILVIDTIKNFIDTYFRAKPNPVLEQQIDTVIARALSALQVALSLTQGVQDIDQAKLDAAFADFQQVYTQLLALIAPLGVTQQGNTLQRTAQGLVVPEPVIMVQSMRRSRK